MAEQESKTKTKPKTKTKRLPKGLRIHNRRLKQAARKPTLGK